MGLRQKENPDEVIKYLVSTTQDEFIIELPAKWKLTFASVNPQSQASGGGYREGFCLRAYEGEKLRGVWGGVTGFRDMSIPFARKIEKQTGSARWEHDSLGNFEEVRSVKKDTELVVENPTDPFS